jgi:hypothetical protein
MVAIVEEGGEEEDTGLGSFRTEKNDDMKKKMT